MILTAVRPLITIGFILFLYPLVQPKEHGRINFLLQNFQSSEVGYVSYAALPSAHTLTELYERFIIKPIDKRVFISKASSITSKNNHAVSS